MRSWKRSVGMQVVSRHEGAYVGKLDDFLFDLTTHRISGWRVKTGTVFSKAGGVAAADLELIGRDVVLVRGESAIEWAGGGRPRPVDGRAWASAYLGVGVLTRLGADRGSVRDLIVDDSGDALLGVLLEGNQLVALDGRGQLGPSAVILESEAVAIALPEDEGKEEWWAKVREILAV